MRRLLASAVTLAATATLGCAGSASTPSPNAADADAPMSCTLSTAGSAIQPVGDHRVGGAVALAKHGDRTLALVADEDAQALMVVDVDQQKQLSETPLDGVPSQLMVAKDGRVIVALRDTSALAVYEVPSDLAQPLRPRCAVAVSTEPVALAATPDDAKVLVSSGWGHSLSAFAASDLAKLAEVELPREPRAVVVSDDGQRAFVSHAVGSSISVVTLEGHRRSRDISMIVDPSQPARATRRPLESFANALFFSRRESDMVAGRFGVRAGCQGYALAKSVEPSGRILAPQVLVDPGDPENAASGYGEGHMPTEVVNVAVIDDRDGALMASSVSITPNMHMMHPPDPREPRTPECLLPRAAAVDPDSSSLFVTCYGIGALVAYDASSANPAIVEKRRWDVGAGPSGVKVDAKNRRAIVWSQFDRRVEVVDIGDVELVDEEQPNAVQIERIALAPSPKVPSHEVRLGRSLFHAVGDARISQDGRACASCHPDGRDDAITWATPDGPRRTKMLAGRLHASAPYSWNGDTEDVETHVTQTFKRLSGQGLKGMERDALIAYLNWVKPPVARVDTSNALVKRGKEVFESEKAACSSCHADETYGDGRAHDVGSRATADRSKQFDTPDLRYLSGRGPYFHDGRYATLSELLRDSDGRMGHTAHLSADDLKALEAYLLTL